MRQAGRYLPEYRALKEKYGFSAIVHEPELAAAATLQPIRRFPELDAAILFNDILSVPEALGQGYAFRDGGGIAMDFTLDSAEKIRALGSPEDVPARLDFAARALRLVRAELGGSRALLGFAGSPWTLAVYMVEGGSARQFAKIKRLAAEEPALFDALMEKLSDAVAASLNLQISAGADAVQIFDSWAALCPAAEYERLSLCWMRRIAAALPVGVPVIVFAKGMAHFAHALFHVCLFPVEPIGDMGKFRFPAQRFQFAQRRHFPRFAAGKAGQADAFAVHLMRRAAVRAFI